VSHYRVASLLAIAACGSEAPPKPPPIAAPADAAVAPAPDLAAYRAALAALEQCPRGSPESARCMETAYRKANAIWPDGVAGARLAMVTSDGKLAARALAHAVDLDDRIPLLDLVAKMREASGDRDGALAAWIDRLALRTDNQIERHAQELAGKVALPDPLQHAIPLAGPYGSLEQYCEALAADGPVRGLHASRCVPKCTGVDDGPTAATASGLEARLVATIQESEAVTGSETSCDVAIRGPDGWYVFASAFTCARCGHAAFPDDPLDKLATQAGVLKLARYASTPRFEAATSEELAFRDVVAGGSPELVVKIRSRLITTGAYDETRNDVSRSDTHELMVCGVGPSRRWSCQRPRTIASDSELVPLRDPSERAIKPQRASWTATMTLDAGHLVLHGVKQNGARPDEDIALVFP
jgi:hypothetical protein